MRRAYQVTEKAPPDTEMAQLDKKIWVHVAGNDFTLEDALRFGWVEEIEAPERFRDEWDIEISFSDPLLPLTGDPMVLASGPQHVTMTVLKGFQKVLQIKDVPGEKFTSNPELLKEMLQILNSFPSSEDGPKRD